MSPTGMEPLTDALHAAAIIANAIISTTTYQSAGWAEGSDLHANVSPVTGEWTIIRVRPWDATVRPAGIDTVTVCANRRTAGYMLTSLILG